MENKYYTPKIEEFYVGFEYQMKWVSEKPDAVWTTMTIASPSALHEICDAKKFPDGKEAWFIGEAIRVKFLDREDIESFGFVERKQGDATYGWLFFHKDEIEISYYISPDRIIIDNGKTYDENETYFQGKLKNKSELKMILKMIGI